MRPDGNTTARSLALCLGLVALVAGPAAAQQKTWTFDADFDSGTLTNVRHVP
jgi:hypothetical protein